MSDGDNIQGRDDRNRSLTGDEVFDTALGANYPTAGQWLEVFRQARMPLWLADVTRVRSAIDTIVSSGVGDLGAWLDSHPDFITRALGMVRVLELSDQAVALFGARDREDFHRSVDRLIVPESLSSFKSMILALATGSPIQNGEATYRTLDGRTIQTWNQVSFLSSSDGSELLLLAMTDISALKSAQRRLQESESRYRTLVETARDLIFCHDLEGRITFANRAAAECTGWSAESLIGRRATELVPARLQEEMQRRAERRTRGAGGVFLYETAYRTADGGEIPVEVSSCLIASPLDGPRMSQVLVVARDISERKRVEREQSRLEAHLRDMRKLESLGVLAGGIAHDFNNFLVAILGSAEILRSDAELSDAQQAQITSILDAAGSIADLSREMQVYAANTAPQHRTRDLGRIVESFSRLIEVSVAGKAAIALECADGLPPVAADEAQIGQVLIQLVLNAVEALGKEGGVIAIRTAQRDVDEEDLDRITGAEGLAPGPYVTCEVRDSGCGIDPHVLPRICEPFFTTKAAGRGTGLFSALGILQQHGGGILFETQPDRGTTVTVLLPALARRAGAGSAQRGARRLDEVELAGKTVLVVDDQKGVRDVTESFLRRLGCGVLIATNGFDAVQVFAQRHREIDLVLLDLGMEGMDGVAAARRMRTIEPGVAIAFVSGFAAEAVRERAVGLEPFGILAKPFRLKALREVVAAGLLRESGETRS